MSDNVTPDRWYIASTLLRMLDKLKMSEHLWQRTHIADYMDRIGVKYEL